MNAGENCSCSPLGPVRERFTSRFVGVDETAGRFGEVSILTCQDCGRPWLKYFVEYESVPRSGRWFLGLIDAPRAASITPDRAVAVLESLEWHVYGGSWFDSTGSRGKGRIAVDC